MKQLEMHQDGHRMLEFLLHLAAMSDEELIAYAGKYGLTPRPEEYGGESISNFRRRVIDVLKPERVK